MRFATAILLGLLALPLGAQDIKFYENGSSAHLVIHGSGAIVACDAEVKTCVGVSDDGRVGLPEGMTMEQAVAFVLHISAYSEMKVYEQMSRLRKEVDFAQERVCRAPQFKIVGKSIGHT